MPNPQAPSLTQYTQWLAEAGTPAFPGSQGTAWMEIGKGSVNRLPLHATNAPTRSELRNIFNRHYLIARYLIEPDARHPANRWLYLADKTYDVQNLSRFTRKSIRHAERYLRFTDLSWDEVREHGEAAFCQTNTRHHQPETTREAFLREINNLSRNPAHRVVGAWLEERLIAFSLLTTVDDWVEGIGRYSTDADRSYRPNEGLYHYVMQRFLFDESYRVICDGLGNEKEGPGLHPFKLKVGFQAIPVHYAIATPVWLRPLLSPAVLSCAKAVLRLRPQNRLLFRAVRTLNQIVNPKRLPANQAAEAEDA